MKGNKLAVLIMLGAICAFLPAVANAHDSLLFLAGTFLFILFYPLFGKYVKPGKSKFRIELLIAVTMIFGLFSLLKILLPEHFDQAKLIVLIMFAVGFKLIFYPIYNLEDSSASSGKE